MNSEQKSTSTTNEDLKPTTLKLRKDGVTSELASHEPLLESNKKLATIVDDDEIRYSPKTTPDTESPDRTPRNGGDHQDEGVGYRVYPKRWFILCVVSLLNWSNTMSWIAYSPASNYVDCYYEGTTAIWLTSVFLIAAIPVAFFAMWSVRKYGLRSAVIMAAITNALGAAIRLISSAIPSPWSRYVVLIGQVFSAVAYPFIMFLPTKVAASWFADSQRATATMIAAMSNPLGVLFANLITPNLVVEAKYVLYLNILLTVVPVVTLVMALVGVTASDPPTPPGHAATQSATPFWAGIKKCMTSRAFISLFIALGGGMGMFNALYGMMQSILCSRGYTNTFAGVCCILMIVGGLCGATASAKVVEKTKRFEETMKISFGIAVVGGICFSLVALRSDIQGAIAFFCFMFGFFGLAAYPIGLETGAECTYPVPETTSTGLIVLSGQVQGFLYIVLMKFLGQPLTSAAAKAKETCSLGSGDSCGGSGEKPEAKDMTVAMMVFSGMAALLALSFIVLFKPRLKRTMMETSGKSAQSKTSGKVAGTSSSSADQNGSNVEMKMMGKGKRVTLSPDEPSVADA